MSLPVAARPVWRAAVRVLPALLAVVAVLLLSGCAAMGSAFSSVFNGRLAAPAADAGAPAAPPVPSVLQGVEIQVEAPRELKVLLERHLDVVRLGRLARDEVDEAEWGRLIDAAPVQVRELLQTEGYFAPTITLDREPGRAPGQRDLVKLQVDPGPRAQIGRVTLEVEGALERAASQGDAAARETLARWKGGFTLPEGSDFRNPAWNTAKAVALAQLRAAGYATAVWSGTGAAVDVPSHSVRLFLVADSGPLFRYGELQVEGLVVHDIDTVANLAGVARGTAVSESMLLDWQERLQKSGLFENVSVTLDIDPARAGDARVLVRLREAPLQAYTFGVGVSANTGPRASVEHTWRRAFGLAASARNKVEWGQKRQFWEGELSSHTSPGLFRNLIGGSIENLESDTDTVLSQRLRIGRAQDRQRLEQLFFVETERSRRETPTTLPANAYAVSLNYHAVRRELDSVVLPTNGYTFAGQLGIGHSRGTNADSGTFTRAYGRFTGYLPLGRTWYGQARLEAGQVFLGTNMVVTESQKFRVGGDDSVRGYSYRSLGPLVDGVVGSGLVMYTASVEVARPILASLPSLWGAAFIDAGNAGNSFSQLSPALGIGVGLRWRSPVGPLRLDWAWAEQTRSARIHFSVGIAF